MSDAAPSEECAMPIAVERAGPNLRADRTGQVAAAGMLTRDFLAWVAREPRSYDETMDAWRSHCPRFTIWEDALAEGLVEVARDSAATFGDRRVTLTPRGRARLENV
jgi:hypothetical protein